MSLDLTGERSNNGDKMFEKYKNKFMVWQLHNRTEIIIAGVSFILGAIIF
jgi:hypothetical protein